MMNLCSVETTQHAATSKSFTSANSNTSVVSSSNEIFNFENTVVLPNNITHHGILSSKDSLNDASCSIISSESRTSEFERFFMKTKSRLFKPSYNQMLIDVKLNNILSELDTLKKMITKNSIEIKETKYRIEKLNKTI